ncbi:M1 family metallopeptidase [Winogradskyella maritima]|uniref:Aminopeptidase N n=1 Tax=Winogradskyella maritima TaxID=1517766 RepID=A0ABV8AFK1_9FLAO|nr:M1 family metallopeptidase [Winogradskyella maritima]
MKYSLAIVFILLFSCAFAQQTDYVDFTHAKAMITVNPDSASVSGHVIYKFNIEKSVDSIYVDARSMTISEVKLNDEVIPFEYNNHKLIIKKEFQESSENKLLVRYSAQPKKALYFLMRNDDWNIWTQGQGKYTSNWLPSFDDVNEKVIFSFDILAPHGYKVLANGALVSTTPNDNGEMWSYSMEKPMSSYLVALVIGKYDAKKETSDSGIPLENYYYPEDSLKFEPTYRYTKRMFDEMESEIGVPFPWQNYKQIPVHDFLYAGMENASATIFSDAFVVDSIGFNDKNYINVNAHEMAHQWFGDLVTAKSGEHHWLQEGFATYYALLAEKSIFGDDYYHFKLYESAQDLARQALQQDNNALLNPKATSLTFYQHGAWVLHALREKVGDLVFRTAVINYLEKHKFWSVETSDFMFEVEALYDGDLSEFKSRWIESDAFPFDDAIELLRSKSSYIHEYMMVDCDAVDSKCAEYLRYDISDEAKIKVIAQAPQLVTNDTFKSSLKVRQAISQYVTKIPAKLKANYETLLDDDSYLTIESALYNLWVNFPEERSKYLSKTKDIYGLSDYNVRMLWLVLNLNTLEFQSDKTQELYNELLSYTGENYSAEVRMNAFQYLEAIKACNAECQENLEASKAHHNWRMVKFAKVMSEKLKSKS